MLAVAATRHLMGASSQVPGKKEKKDSTRQSTSHKFKSSPHATDQKEHGRHKSSSKQKSRRRPRKDKVGGFRRTN